jgi:hypothetical protein
MPVIINEFEALAEAPASSAAPNESDAEREKPADSLRAAMTSSDSMGCTSDPLAIPGSAVVALWCDVR